MPRSTPSPEHFQYARKMIFLGIVFVPFVTVALALGVSSIMFTETFSSSAHDALKGVVAERARDIEAYLEERHNDLQFVLDTFSPVELSQAVVLESLLVRLKEKSSSFDELCLVDAGVGVMASTGSRNQGGGVCESRVRGGARGAQARVIGEVHTDEAGVTWLNIVASKRDAPASAALCATLDSRAIIRALDIGRQKGSAELLLYSAQNLEQTQGGPVSEYERFVDLGGHAVSGGKVASFVLEGGDGVKRLFAAVRLKERGLLLVARQPLSDAFNDLFQVGWYVLAISLLGGVVTLSLGSVVSQRIGHALKEADEVRDVLRERLSRSVRLAELGEMTSGFAHEINNPLQVMESEITMMELALDDFRDSEDGDADMLERNLRDNLGELQQQIRRCSTVTKSILMFGRQGSAEEGAAIALGDVMRDVGAMVRKKAEIQSVDIRIHVEPESLAVSGDVGKVRQVFLNLLNNAVYAVVEKFAGRQGGRLDFAARQHGESWVVVEVRDNGPGIPAEVLDNIYTPFFTTKPPQKGTGLGLAVCYGLIESMGGSIDVDTRQGAGTVFRITLPAV